MTDVPFEWHCDLCGARGCAVKEFVAVDAYLSHVRKCVAVADAARLSEKRMVFLTEGELSALRSILKKADGR